MTITYPERRFKCNDLVKICDVCGQVLANDNHEKQEDNNIYSYECYIVDELAQPLQNSGESEPLAVNERDDI
jgi:heterodisulfide reductase subunit B